MLLSVRMYFDVYLQWRYLVGVHMKYSELVESGAPTSELQSYLVDSELVTVTLRLPRTMRESAKEYANLNGLTFTSLVEQCLIERLTEKD